MTASTCSSVEQMVHRQKQRRLEEAVGPRQLLDEAERAELVKRRPAPLNDRPDPPVGKMLAQRVAAAAADLVILEDVEVPGCRLGGGGKLELGDAAECLIIACGNLAPPRDRLVVPVELERAGSQRGCCRAGRWFPTARNPAEMRFVGARTVVAHRADRRCELVVVGDQRAGIAEAAERFRRIEAERRPPSERARRGARRSVRQAPAPHPRRFPAHARRRSPGARPCGTRGR